ncbi:MAG: helix-turn-helix transcriptional regulator [Leptospirales bacterium]
MVTLEKKYLNEREVSAIYGFGIPWLKKKRLTGGGPVFAKIGRNVRYSVESVEAFLKAGEVRSTSDYSERRG